MTYCMTRRRDSNMISLDLTVLPAAEALAVSAVRAVSVWMIYSACLAMCSADVEDSAALAEADSAGASIVLLSNAVRIYV